MIVSDSTALIALINIDEFQLLELFGKKIIIPTDVYEEISVKIETKKFLDKHIELGHIKVSSFENKSLYNELSILLDRGESASIVLALELSAPLLIDEKKGRKVAQNMGISIVGLVGVIRFLYRTNKISKRRTKEILDKLDSSSFRISKKLIETVLE